MTSIRALPAYFKFPFYAYFFQNRSKIFIEHIGPDRSVHNQWFSEHNTSLSISTNIKSCWVWKKDDTLDDTVTNVSLLLWEQGKLLKSVASKHIKIHIPYQRTDSAQFVSWTTVGCSATICFEKGNNNRQYTELNVITLMIR